MLTFLNEDRLTFFRASAAVCPATTCKSRMLSLLLSKIFMLLEGYAIEEGHRCEEAQHEHHTFATGRRLYAMDLMPVSLKEASPA